MKDESCSGCYYNVGGKCHFGPPTVHVVETWEEGYHTLPDRMVKKTVTVYPDAISRCGQFKQTMITEDLR